MGLNKTLFITNSDQEFVEYWKNIKNTMKSITFWKEFDEKQKEDVVRAIKNDLDETQKYKELAYFPLKINCIVFGSNLEKRTLQASNTTE